ncbi:hypothetical protein Rt10032_c20g6290 [Rhodotorula toruloides]|uniref:Gag-Pol polyprotein n=1 Tax=Rhodotorula toruloides TaxID=5286 RepID=A0A511KPH7_RHOTO|nr:hypothetical protein Rt10032_c20g6290 [Rhodotorula toruloides]
MAGRVSRGHRPWTPRLDSLGYSEAQELLDLLHSDPGQLETRISARLLPFADTDPSYLVPLPPSPDSSLLEDLHTSSTTPDLVHPAPASPSTMSEYSGMSRALQQQVLATLEPLSTTTWQEWERELPKLVAAGSGVPEADLCIDGAIKRPDYLDGNLTEVFSDAVKKAEYARWKRMTDSLIILLKLQGGPDVQGRLVDFDSKRGDLPTLWANLRKWYGNTTVGAERVVGTQKLVTERWDGDESPSLYFSRLKGLQNRVNAAYREDAKVATDQNDKNVIADLNAAISDSFLRDLILATLPESYAEPLLPSISRTTSLDDLKNLVTNLYLSRQSRGDIADLEAARRTSTPPGPAPAHQQQQLSVQQQRQGGGKRDTKSQKPKKAATLYPSYERWHGGTFVDRNNVTRFSIPYMTCYQCFQHGHVAKDCRTDDKARSRVKELAKDGVKVPIGDAMALWAFDTNPGGPVLDQAAADALRALAASSTPPPPPSDQPAQAQFVTVVDSVDTSPRAFLVESAGPAAALRVVAKNNYVIDSGATRHFCSIREHLHDYVPYTTPHPITGVFGSAGSGLGEGRLVFRLPDGDISITSVMYAPDLGVNLLSLTHLMLKGMRFTNDRKMFTAVDEAGRRIWQLPVGTSIAVPAAQIVRPPRSSLALAATDTADAAMRRHRRLGHLSDQRAKQLESSSVGLDAIKSTAMPICDACEKAKATRQPHPTTASNPPSKRLEVVSADTWGPAPIRGVKGERYALALVDQKSRYLWGKALQSKGGITDVVIERLKKVERQSGDKVGALQTDNGTEFVNKTMDSFTKSAGIQHRRSIPYNHTQNGFIERRFRSLFESVRAMLLDSGLPTSLWPYAYESALYLSNRSPTSTLGGKTPYEAFHGEPPDLSNLRAWGCSAYLRLAPEGPNAPHKLAARGVHARFIGYPEDNKGWILWVPEWRKVVVAWDVKFYESTFGKARDADDEAGHEAWLEEMVELEAREGTREGGMDGRKDTPAPPFASPNPFQSLANDDDDAGSDDGYESAPEDTLSSPSPSRQSSPSPPPIPLPTVVPPRTEATAPEPERRLTRSTGLQPSHFVPQQGTPGTPGAAWDIPPSTMSDAQKHAHNSALVQRVESVALSTFAGDSPLLRPRNLLDYARLDLDLDRSETAVVYTAFECAPDAGNSEVTAEIVRALATGPPWSGSHDQPTYKQALSRPDAEKWLDAMHVELAAFSATGTWDEELVDLPAGRKAIAVKWVLLIKRDANGHVVKYKARLVARGDQQVEGVDYDETHSSTVRLTTVRLVFALLAHCRHFSFKQFDISNAYLLGGLDKEIYIQQAPGFVDSDKPRAVRRLRSALYGLKQGGREWQKVLRGALERIGFARSTADHGLYIRRRNGKVAYVPTHVDDGLVVGDDDLGQVLSDLDGELGGKLKEVETGLFLGMRIRREHDGKVTLDQSHYARAVLERFFPKGLKPVSTPLDADYASVGAATEDERYDCNYRELLGALVYLAACTRPDLSFALSFASRFASCPAERHWRLLLRISRYATPAPLLDTFGLLDFALSRSSRLRLASLDFHRTDTVGQVAVELMKTEVE